MKTLKKNVNSDISKNTGISMVKWVNVKKKQITHRLTPLIIINGYFHDVCR